MVNSSLTSRQDKQQVFYRLKVTCRNFKVKQAQVLEIFLVCFDFMNDLIEFKFDE